MRCSAATVLPIGGDEFRLLSNFVNVVGERQGHDISFQTIDDRAGLLCGATMGLVNGDDPAVFFLASMWRMQR